MLIAHLILAALASGALARWPSRAISTCVVAVAGAAAILLGAPVAPALGVAAPLFAFLAAALTLAALVERSGLAERAAATLAIHARGNALLLYGLVCALCVLLTAVVSLDGAIVLMVPLVLALNRRWSVPLAPLFVGVVAVVLAGSWAYAASIGLAVGSLATPQGSVATLIARDLAGPLAPAHPTGRFAALAAGALAAATLLLWAV